MSLTLEQRQLSPEERFWTRVTKTEGCWVFGSGSYQHGYGCYQFTVEGRRHRVLAHRFAYEALVGEVPLGMQLHHLCHNKACVNPSHLEVVSVAAHALQPAHVAHTHKTKTHCPRGHLYDEENTRLYGPRSEWRDCRSCRRERARERRARNRVCA